MKDSRDLARQIAATAPSSEVAIGFIRDGKAETVTATLARTQLQPALRVTANGKGDEQQTDKLGLTLAPAAEVEGAGSHGLAVLNVARGKADELGFETGDVILKVGNKNVEGVASFEQSIEAAGAKGQSNVLVLVRRDDNQHFVAMPLSTG